MSQSDRELDDLAIDLARYSAVAAPAALRARVRAEIMAAPVPSPAAPSGWLGLLRPLVAAALVIAVLAAAGASAAAGSLPGDPGFAIKRAVEDVQVTLSADETARLGVLSDQLDRRLADLEAIAAHRPGALSVALDEFAAALARVEAQLAVVAQQRATPARDAAMVRATATAEDHIARLSALGATLPATAVPGIERAIDAQQRIHGEDRAPQTPGTTASPTRPGTAPTARPTTPPSRTERTATPTRP
jgi:hypothetical protein